MAEQIGKPDLAKLLTTYFSYIGLRDDTRYTKLQDMDALAERVWEGKDPKLLEAIKQNREFAEFMEGIKRKHSSVYGLQGGRYFDFLKEKTNIPKTTQ